ncbi:PREDICTED: mitochondria-eating protein [Dipodomys ordii]|uniref:Mitochondria-eating protein n=1 Tax=Dipodomys ordii TaxID=10020 RepID=A0A1S3EK93_DIPOR|nr:PREDICTED: mitochondria-eating protein [Dipodomys ordii]
MADNLKKLVSKENLLALQEKLNSWAKDYNKNTCDENLNVCLELIEQVAKLQGQLFTILTSAAQEGGHNEGVEIIKLRLLPWLEAAFTAASTGKALDSKVPSLQNTFDREKNKDTNIQDVDLQQLDNDMKETREQLNQVQDDLPEAGKPLEESKNRSTVSLLAAEEEINQLKKQLKSLQAQEDARHRNSEPRRSEQYRSERSSIKRTSEQRHIDKTPRVSEQRNSEIADYEKQVRNLKDEIAVLSSEKTGLQGRSARSRSPSPVQRSHRDSRSRSPNRSRSRSRSGSPSVAIAKVRSPSPNRSKMSSVARKAALLSRFSDAYSQARLDAQCLLRRCIDKAETVQRIIYIATVEAFHVAKMAFRHFKIRVRKSLTPSYVGSNDFETAVSEYIICHLDLYDSQSSVNDVIRAMNVNPKISFPPEVDFCLLSDFIQEICCIAFAMQSLDPPLDIAFGADGEVFNDCKYRRSYDSDFAAPLVFYHVWPALMENDCVIMKGEAVTRRGAFWNSMRSVSRCRSRSLSPIYPRSHIGLSTMSRSRSPSPVRCLLPRF